MRLCGVDGTPLEQTSESQPVRDLYIGRTINGRYQIISKLGEDGVGTGYLAEQVSMARKVVLKLFQRNYATHDDLVARFRREARLAASLNHPLSLQFTTSIRPTMRPYLARWSMSILRALKM